jgi:hypothetical protein
MPQIIITWDTHATDEMLRVLNERLLALDGPLLDIAAVVTEYITRNFEDAPWPPLAPSTVELKQALGYPFDPLVRTGDMKDSATSDDWQVSGSGRTWRAKLEVPGYSNFHFTGTRWMPMRDYALLPDSIEGDIAAILEAALFEGLQLF